MQTFARKHKTQGQILRKISAPFYSHGSDSQQAAIRRILRSAGAQAKLTIGAPNDVYEQEADRVADEVMRMPDPRIQATATCKAGECPRVAEETVQLKPLSDWITPLVQRQNEEEEAEDLLQTKSANGRTSAVTPNVAAEIAAMQGRGQPLPEAERAYFEPRFGHDFSEVRVHTGSQAATVAKAVNAKAFTVGRNIVFGAGGYTPGNASGRQLLAHELTHVVQQNTAFGPTIQRLEVDESAGCTHLPDSTSWINSFVNTRLGYARAAAKGNPQLFFQESIDRLAGAEDIRKGEWPTPIEKYVDDPTNLVSLQTERPKPETTKYAGIIWLDQFPPAPIMNIGGICVGTDKLGHFFQQGYAYFETAAAPGGTDEKAEHLGHTRELGKLGLWGGVYSRADLVANRKGLDFYRNLSNDMNLTFDIANYVSTDWSEDINRSYYGAGLAAKLPTVAPTYEIVWHNLLRGYWDGTYSIESDEGEDVEREVWINLNIGQVDGRSYVYGPCKDWYGGLHFWGEIDKGWIVYNKVNLDANDPRAVVVSGVIILFEFTNFLTGLRGRGRWDSLNEKWLFGSWGYDQRSTGGGEWALTKR